MVLEVRNNDPVYLREHGKAAVLGRAELPLREMLIDDPHEARRARARSLRSLSSSLFFPPSPPPSSFSLFSSLTLSCALYPHTHARTHTASLHMHTFGHTGRFFVEHEDGSETCLLDIDDWDFNWQRDYDFQIPVKLAAGDRLSVRCSWDNPTDQDLNWGEGTGDEMCLATMFVTAGDYE